MRRSDGELVAETRGGSWSSFAELVGRYRDAVCGVAYHYLGDFDEAQDAAQEAFVRAYLHLQQLREPEKFGPWLRKIAASVAADLLRRRGDRALSLEEAGAEMGEPDADLERAAARVVVRQALGKLSEKARLAVTLFYINGYSQAEVADFLDIPVTTVRTRLHRAKLRLREEMTEMVGDVLHEGRPGPEFEKRVVEEAMRRAGEAQQAHDAAEALRQYDEALAAVERMPPGAEQQRLKMEALRGKGSASIIPRSYKEALTLYEQALETAHALGDREQEASLMAEVGNTSFGLGKEDDSRHWYEQALALYRELGDVLGEANCLYALARLLFDTENLAAARQNLELAAELFGRANEPAWMACAYATLKLLREVGDERLPKLLSWTACCDGLKDEDRAVTYEFQPGYGESSHDTGAVHFPAKDVFHQVARLRKFLDPAVPVGGTWYGDSFSFTYRPTHSVATVKSRSEHVETPAGSFENCLLMEHTTEEHPDDGDAPERKREANRNFACGMRRAWYAPGVGMVQLQVVRTDGAEALLQLTEHSVADGGNRYLPLALGNEWHYRQVNLAPQYITKESYRVAAREGEVWCLEHWDYLYKEE